MARIIHEDGYRYPLIPKKYYAAVMFACKMIRQNGYKNKAIRIAANYYGVNEDELREHVDARTAAGTRAAAKEHKREPITRKWYVVELIYYDNFETCSHNGFVAVSAKNANNAVSNAQRKANDESRRSFRMAGFYGDSVHYGGQLVAVAASKKEADAIVEKLDEEYDKAENSYVQGQLCMSFEACQAAREKYRNHLELLAETIAKEKNDE